MELLHNNKAFLTQRGKIVNQGTQNWKRCYLVFCHKQFLYDYVFF